MTVLITAVIVLLVALLAFGLLRWLRFPAGPSGPVPLSSGSLNAELIRAATAQLGRSDSTQVKAILNSVARRQYDSALSAIDQMLTIERHPDVQTLLLWAKSNVYQRTQRLHEEIDVLKQLCALRPHPLFELNLGIAHSRLRNYSDAEVHCLQAIDLMNGRYPLAIFNLGIIYCDMRRRPEAIQQLSALERFGRNVPKRLIRKLRERVSELG